jgi:hypothetical protein
MTSHPYLRAYLAGVAFPSMFIPVILLGYAIARYGFGVPVPLERGLIFPLALVPNIFGLWNMLYQRVHRTSTIPIGLFGAVLPFLILPCGYALTRALGILTLQESTVTWFGALSVRYVVLLTGFCIEVVFYYLLWKYIVTFFNETLGIA